MPEMTSIGPEQLSGSGRRSVSWSSTLRANENALESAAVATAAGTVADGLFEPARDGGHVRVAVARDALGVLGADAERVDETAATDLERAPQLATNARCGLPVPQLRTPGDAYEAAERGERSSEHEARSAE